MRTTMRAVAWVVYKVTIHGKPGEVNAVCEQGEWDAMERERPGHHVLVKARIPHEAEAEALARAGSGYAAGKAKGGKGRQSPFARAVAVPALPARAAG